VFTSGTFAGSVRISKAADDLRTGSATFTDLMTVLSNGNVGIGASPNSPLQVQCTDGYQGGITLSSTASGAASYFDYMIQRGPSSGSTILGAGTNLSNVMLFHTINETFNPAPPGGTKTGFVWASSGQRLGMYFDTTNTRLGIGTTNPTQLFELYSPAASTSHSTLFTGNRIPQTGGGVAKNYLQIQCQDATTLSLGSNITLFTDTFSVGPSIDYSSTRHNFINNSGAKIGYFQAILSGSTTTTLSVDTSGGIFRTGSDARLKNNIQNIQYGLDEINALRPVTHTWIDKRYGSGRQIGMIAQEVAQILPEVVGAANDEDRTLSLDYQKVVPVLVKAVQELSAKNAALEARLAALEAK